MSRPRAARLCFPMFCAVLLLAATPSAAAPEGTLTFALHFSPVTRWLDPAEGESTITPFLLLYALHDGLLKPMAGSGSAPSLAESWSMAKDGLSAEFILRPGDQIPQWRSRHLGRRQVLLRALPGWGRQDPQGYRQGDSATWPQPPAIRPQGAQARLPRLLRHPRGQRRLGGAQEVRRAGRRGGLSQGAHRGRPLQVRELQPGG